MSLFLYGASGHGKVIKEILESQGRRVAGFVDDNPEIEEQAGLPVLHTMKNVNEVIVSIGANDIRKNVVEKIKCKIASPAIHSKAILSPTVKIGEGSVVMAGAVINADTTVGRHCIVNTGASIDHDCAIYDFVHISPHVTLCGQVTVGGCSWIGAGTVVIQGKTIGKNCIIGAGSVIICDIPDNSLAYGNPCKVIKKM